MKIALKKFNRKNNILKSKSPEMKNLGMAVLTACICLFSLAGLAQDVQKKAVVPNEPDYNKPKLFADLPDKVDFNPEIFSNLFQLEIGQSVNIPISASFSFSGKLVSKSNGVRSSSVVINSTNRVGARLIFTKVTAEDNSIKYLGRIISLKHGDCYEIILENNQYYFKKKGIYELMSE